MAEQNLEGCTNVIFQNILDAMQEAEELGGPADVYEYIALMSAIISEAETRILNARKVHASEEKT